VASNVAPGAGSWFKFTFGYTTYNGGIGNSQQEEPWNTYPPEVKNPEEINSFTEHGQVVSHRLIRISPNDTITTKGDGNRTADPWHVSTRNIIGGVVAAPRRLGYLLTYLRLSEGAASILLALLCLWQIWGLAGELSAERPRGAALAGPG
jgi:hypothetical protein